MGPSRYLRSTRANVMVTFARVRYEALGLIVGAVRTPLRAIGPAPRGVRAVGMMRASMSVGTMPVVTGTVMGPTGRLMRIDPHLLELFLKRCGDLVGQRLELSVLFG